MINSKKNIGYAQNQGGRNAFSGMRGYKKKFKKAELDTAPEGEQPNKIEESKKDDVQVNEFETNPEKEVEK
jgi:hypothetical protein